LQKLTIGKNGVDERWCMWEIARRTILNHQRYRQGRNPASPRKVLSHDARRVARGARLDQSQKFRYARTKRMNSVQRHEVGPANGFPGRVSSLAVSVSDCH
jgi:hypothetical protein